MKRRRISQERSVHHARAASTSHHDAKLFSPAISQERPEHAVSAYNSKFEPAKTSTKTNLK
jgi:hypothetical protein